MFYAHSFEEISRMKTLGIDLEKYTKEKPSKFCNDSYKINGIGREKKNPFDMLIADLEDEINERSQTFQFIRAFAEILLFCERILLYQNDDNKEMWAVETDENTISAFFEFLDTQVECRFKKSAINVDKNLSENNLVDKILGIDQAEYVTFIEIEINRTFGNNFYTNYKSILGSNEFNLNPDDVWLMDLICTNMHRIMINTLSNLKQHILHNCLQINNLTVEDFENGVEIWRSR